jgi:DNA-binding LacI/PurR family transcriptional regulator
VVINDFWTESRTDSGVSYDEEMSVEIVVAHMLKLGHRSLAMVEHDHAPRHRAIHRFLAVLKREGLPHEDGRILLHKASDHVPLEILYGPGAPNPTALVTVYDIVALRVMRRLQQLGLRVPQDVSVGNVNGQPLDGGDGLGLTTAVPPVQEIVDCALALLLKRPRDAHAVQHCLKPLFHEGQTTGPAPAHVPRLDRVPGGGPRLQSEQGAPGAG